MWLPAGRQHQLQAGRALRAAQRHQQRREFGAGAHRDALQKLEIVSGIHRLGLILRHKPLLANGRVARVGQQVAAVGRLYPATLQQRGQHIGPRAAVQQ